MTHSGGRSVNIKNIIAVAIGGMVGTWLRYAMYIWFNMDWFPLSTLLVNLLGSLLLGLLTGAASQILIKEWLKVGLGVGLCGGFTTMSAFSEDAWRLLMNGQMLILVTYVVTSVGLGIALAATGYLIAKKMLRSNRKAERQVGRR
ncbi:hypothetical protein AB990_19710 [Alkalihalobacillus pseudalcaliphilus]|nr:hypothetical protein AB990_19710 [Alkalihalobacillus pseudalcaliphilus]